VSKNFDLIRVCKITPEDGLPYGKSCFYKWAHLGKHREIFVRFGGGLFIDRIALERAMEAGRLLGER
jgi:hypothetical protein